MKIYYSYLRIYPSAKAAKFHSETNDIIAIKCSSILYAGTDKVKQMELIHHHRKQVSCLYGLVRCYKYRTVGHELGPRLGRM